MKKILLEILIKQYQSIFSNWLEKLSLDFNNKFSEAQLKTFIETSLNIFKEIIRTSEYAFADQYLIDAYNLFSKKQLNLLEISRIFHFGRISLQNNIDEDSSFNFDPIILIGFADEVIEQIFARYVMIHQKAQMVELEKDRDRLASKLDMNQRYLKNILHTSEYAIAVIDKEEKFTSWNKGAEELFGFKEHEVLGKSSSLLLPNGKKYYEELDYIKKEIQRTNDLKILDTERKTKSGRIIPVELSVARLPSRNDEYMGRTVILKDQSQVKHLQQQIDQSEKLAVIGQLAAGIAHEIGNPLASISSLVQLIQRKNNDQVLDDQLVAIKENIDRISGIVRELVDFSRPPSYERAVIQVTDIIKTAVGIVKYDKRVKKVNFETEFDSDLPLIKIVPDQLLQVFVNILINALDAIEGEGTINVKSHHTDDAILIDITDNGHGIEKEIINKIFDPFFTTKDVGKGTGLGLSVSYGIVKNFHGDVFVKSRKNQGSTFTVKLPVLDK
ncbi:MAG: PAS domain S-box protein [Bacteroidetes bacterium]|nr:PAS domain S-box protein [Bacteroidota bacterium]MBU1679475.1 PAS domain S-box protein [Bacteroidota bacterium]MBU2508552.1 PAS domain S-box protein [Bacteroidota bacterium]